MSDPIRTAMRVVLCARLHKRGLIDQNCDGSRQCVFCDRTIDAMEVARKAETRVEIDRHFDAAEGSVQPVASAPTSPPPPKPKR